jgi:hypothetical protein
MAEAGNMPVLAWFRPGGTAPPGCSKCVNGLRQVNNPGWTLPGVHGRIVMGMLYMPLASPGYQDELHLDVSEPGLTGCMAPACRNRPAACDRADGRCLRGVCKTRADSP